MPHPTLLIGGYQITQSLQMVSLPHGALALADFIGESPVNCQPVDTDHYGRIVANCYVRGRDIEEWLISEGWAMAYRRYSSDYIGAEQAAKNAKRGFWVGTVQPPWEWRRGGSP